MSVVDIAAVKDPVDTPAPGGLVIRLPDGTELGPTMKAEEVARWWQISVWEVYAAAKRGDLPVAPIVIGKRIMRWPTVAVLKSVGINA